MHDEGSRVQSYLSASLSVCHVVLIRVVVVIDESSERVTMKRNRATNVPGVLYRPLCNRQTVWVFHRGCHIRLQRTYR